MKLLHKLLLAACLPYLLLIVVVWIVQLGWLEPAERNRIRADAKRELTSQAVMIRHNLQRALSQLELISWLPGMKSGDLTSVAAELKQIGAAQDDLFAGLHLHALNPKVAAVQSLLVHPADEERLNQGQSVVSNFHVTTAGTRPTVSLMVPVTVGSDTPSYALIGEVSLVDVLPQLDPNQNQEITEYSLIDTMGKEYHAANIRAMMSGPRWAQPQSDGWSQIGIERVSVQISPWNWQIVKTIHWPRSLGGLRFQQFLLTVQCLLAMFLTAAVIMWLNRKTDSRLAKLIETIQIFGASDPSVRVADDQPDEIGRLAETFNCMADDVAHAQRRLQKQLAEHQQTPGQWQERVAELEARLAELERYAGHLAHEFQGPLATLEGFAATLAAAAKSGEWDQFDRDQARLKAICGRLRAISDALLRLAKRDATLATDSVSLSAAAKEAGELLLREMESLEISDQLPTVAGDPVLWRHVFTNLLQNALKACGETTSPRIEIGCEQRNGELVCYVRDNGCGMSLRELEQAFHGAGLGLGLVRRIVEHHGGKVWAESRGPGTGTTIVWTVTQPQP